MASAQEQGSASAATVLQRHLARALAASQLTSPEQLLVGVAEGGAFLHFLFAYRDPAQGGGAQHYDENLGCVQRGGGGGSVCAGAHAMCNPPPTRPHAPHTHIHPLLARAA